MSKKRGINSLNFGVFSKSKKGMSEVIATLMIILLVLATVAVIWIVIRNLISSGTEDIDLDGMQIYLNIENAQLVTQAGFPIIKLSVNRDAGGGTLTGIRFIFSDAENSYPIDSEISMAELERQMFAFSSTEFTDLDGNITLLTEVSVAPIYKATGTEKVGQITDTSEIINNLAKGDDGTLPGCGNYLLELGEECDDGNTVSGDGCSNICQTEGVGGAICGNNVIETGETCDDGNIQNGDGCSNICQTEGVGSAICGNNVIETGETCDDGNIFSGDGCSSSCQIETGIPFCGNYITESGEECDDGNINDGDGCSATCQLEGAASCGNNIVESGETCDGTNLNGKTCISLGFVSGTLDCDDFCQFDTVLCVEQTPLSCDGIWNPPEDSGVECDGTSLPKGCASNCKCKTGFTSNGNNVCTLNPPLNTGIIFSVWPIGSVKYFDSINLPKDSLTVTRYIGKYINFSNSAETQCLRINFAEYLPAVNRSYLRVSEVAQINTNENYAVWEAENCGL